MNVGRRRPFRVVGRRLPLHRPGRRRRARCTRTTPSRSPSVERRAFASAPAIAKRGRSTTAWSSPRASRTRWTRPNAPLNAVLFVEPETREGRALDRALRADGHRRRCPTASLAELRPRCSPRGRSSASVAAHRQRGAGGRARAHRGRGAARRLRRAHPPRDGVHQEPSRLAAHARGGRRGGVPLAEPLPALFVEQTGMALRPYILWRRFLHVWELLTAGESLSAAAHAAGFADAAHLTRTSRRCSASRRRRCSLPPAAPDDARLGHHRRSPARAAIERRTQPLRSRGPAASFKSEKPAPVT